MRKITHGVCDTREKGKFALEIPLKTKEYLLNNKNPEINKKAGVVFIVYELSKKNAVKQFVSNEEEEI